LPKRHRPRLDGAVTRGRFLPIFAAAAAAPAWAQPQTLGAFGNWAAFRDGARCYAITQPYQASGAEGWQPFASVGQWPGRGRGGQLHIRLSREKRQGSAVLLRIDGRAFQLIGGGRDAWAPDARADAEIQAAMRTGVDFVVETRSTQGLIVRDLYRLRGAATAMDAAAIACAPRR
jgi:hypothetical protein